MAKKKEPIVLIVDDEHLNADALKRLIKMEFPSSFVSVADSVGKALKFSQNVFYTVLITDGHMPYWNGITLFKKLKRYYSDLGRKNLQGILYSGDYDFKPLAEDEGMYFLKKPVDCKPLFDTIENCFM